MKPWRNPFAALALILISALLIVILPLSSLAAPQGLAGTPYFLPVVLKNFPLTPTPTATATATATPTPTRTSTPTATPITSTIPITVGTNGFLIFSPMTVTIHVGDTIRWVWGSTGHTVTSGTAPTPDNQFCSPNNMDCPGFHFSSVGTTYDHQFLVAGTYQYFCEFHYSSGMTGTITVLP
jgi:plastocyanin